MKHLRKFMFTAAALFAVLSVIFLISHIHHDNHYSFTCFITFLTCFYHFAYRILVSEAVSKKHASFNYRNGWFAPKKFEESVFKALRVKRWKEKLPNLLPQTSSTTRLARLKLLTRSILFSASYRLPFRCSTVSTNGFSLFQDWLRLCLTFASLFSTGISGRD